MLRVRLYFVIVVMSLLAACGGGGTISDDGSGGGTTEVISINLSLTNASGAVATDVSKAQPLTLTATLTSSTGRSMAGQLVTFSLNDALLANFNNEAGTAQTNSGGVATIGVLVGAKSGAGTIAATLTGGQTKTISFASAGDGDEVEPEKPVGSIRLIADTLQLGSGNTAKVALSAVILDPKNVLQPGVAVQFSTSSGELELVNAVTGADGVAKANLSSSVDPSLRKVTVTASVGDKTATIDIDVVGTSILIAAPRSMVLGDQVSITADLTDFAGKGIQGRTLAVTSALGNPITSTSLVTAGNSGRVTFSYKATVGGADELRVTGLGATAIAAISIQSDQFRFLNTNVIEVPLGAEQQLTAEWLVNGVPNANKALNLTTTRGTIGLLTGNLTQVSVDQSTNAQGQASVLVASNFAGFANIAATEIRAGSTDLLTTQTLVEFVAINPAKIEVSAFPAQLGPGEQSVVRAVVRDIENNPVKNQTVAFTLNGAPGGRINPATAITDSQGLASTVFTADNTTGAGDGKNLNVRASVLNTEFFGETPIAVGTRTLFFRFGTGNSISEPSSSLFVQEFSVLVTDSSGNPVAGQDLNVSVLPLSYNKGFWRAFPNTTDFEIWEAVETTQNCGSEDDNNNGILDPLEDDNGDGQLTPGNIASVPRTVRADSNGIATFTVTYPKDVAPWTIVRLAVSGFADGTENISSREYKTQVSSTYVSNEFAKPAVNPFGQSASCASEDWVVSIDFGTGDNVTSPSTELFNESFNVVVRDFDGEELHATELNVSVMPMSYRKGLWEKSFENGAFRFWNAKATINCESEDLNHNGIMDAGEDRNGDGRLTPGDVVSVIQQPPQVGDVGVTFDLSYQKNVAPWTKALLNVSGKVNGVKFTRGVEYQTKVAAPYILAENAIPLVNPYGINTICTDAN